MPHLQRPKRHQQTLQAMHTSILKMTVPLVLGRTHSSSDLTYTPPGLLQSALGPRLPTSVRQPGRCRAPRTARDILAVDGTSSGIESILKSWDRPGVRLGVGRFCDLGVYTRGSAKFRVRADYPPIAHHLPNKPVKSSQRKPTSGNNATNSL